MPNHTHRPPGRLPAYVLDPNASAVFGQEVREVDYRGRLTVPARLFTGLPWMAQEANGEVLIVLDEEGRLRLLDWNSEGPAVLQYRSELLEAAVSDDEAREAVLALDDRFLRGRMESSGRFMLPPAAVVHLLGGPALGARSGAALYVVRVPQSLEFWSEGYRNQRRRTAHGLLEGLP